MISSPLMVGLGEVLWDILPSGRVLGGAPANFAYMANVLEARGIVASRVGKDVLGNEARAQIENLGLETTFLQQDDEHETGTAKVSVDSAGQPTFTIAEPASWDFLQWTPQWEKLSARADVICFGSLAQRSSLSAASIDSFLRNSRPAAIRIFDVNLRQSYYSAEVLRRSLRHANVVKLTDHELRRVASLLRMDSGNLEELGRRLLLEYDLMLVCITRGARGSLLVSERETVDHPGFAVQVVDTVGAGDAFAACLAHHFILGRSMTEMSEAANRFASWIATQAGATPRIDRGMLGEILGHSTRTSEALS